MSGRAAASSLSRLLRPKSIAVIGGREAGEVLNQCDGLGFDGPLWPVNTKRETMAGRHCYPSIESLPEAPDATFIAIPADATVESVVVLAARGAGGAVCYAAGFKEAGGRGADRQQRLIEAARTMPVIGPNCYGVLNYLDGAALWPDQHGGRRVERGVAIVTQSGNIGVNLTMQQRSLPLAYLVSAGNQAVVGIPELIQAFLEDDRVSAIGIHLEGVADPAAFENAALLALERRIPIVALKTGRSPAGAALTLSHTATLAGPDALYDTLFERFGIASASTVPEFIETLKFLHAGGPLNGTRIASMSCSGGEASLVADLAAGRTVSFPELSDEHRTEVAAVLGEHVHVSNPLDYHTYIWGNEQQLRNTFTAMMRGGFDVTMLVLDFPRGDRCRQDDWWPTINALADAANTTGHRAAVVASLGECMPETVGDRLLAEGLAPMHGMAEALSAFEAAAAVGRAQSRRPPVHLLHTALRAGEPATYDEWHSKRMLATYGLNVPEGALVSSPTEAVAAAEALGFPVAVKAVSARLIHKSEQNALALGLTTADEVHAAAEQFERLGGRVLVEKMVTDGIVELIVGVNRDPQFGPYLVVGLGGIFVEIFDDTRVLPLPTDFKAVASALAGLSSAPLLDGYRGRPKADIDAAVDAILAVARFAEEHASTLIELDINPLIVRPAGLGAVAADALIRLVNRNG